MSDSGGPEWVANQGRVTLRSLELPEMVFQLEGHVFFAERLPLQSLYRQVSARQQGPQRLDQHGVTLQVIERLPERGWVAPDAARGALLVRVITRIDQGRLAGHEPALDPIQSGRQQPAQRQVWIRRWVRSLELHIGRTSTIRGQARWHADGALAVVRPPGRVG